MPRSARRPLSKTHIAARIAREQGITKEKALQILDQIAHMAYEHADVGFRLPGIGKLEVTAHKPRKRYDPTTGKKVDMPARRVVKFRVAKAAQGSARPVSSRYGARGRGRG